jgi:hypothetical protein
MVMVMMVVFTRGMVMSMVVMLAICMVINIVPVVAMMGRMESAIPLYMWFIRATIPTLWTMALAPKAVVVAFAPRAVVVAFTVMLAGTARITMMS